jgi:hypothetical protein
LDAGPAAPRARLGQACEATGGLGQLFARLEPQTENDSGNRPGLDLPVATCANAAPVADQSGMAVE